MRWNTFATCAITLENKGMEMNRKFTHLHLHTPYSLLDGFAKMEDLVLKAKEDGMDAVAITDHGVMFGVVDFYRIAKKHGVKPIIGCEVYVAARTRHDKEPMDKSSYHLVLLAENDSGYQNLIRLVSLSFTEGYYYKPRVDIQALQEHCEGLIALSACLGGEVQQKLLKDRYEEAMESAKKYRDIFGEGNFFLELQDHGIPEQSIVNNRLRQLSKESGIPLVATNDVHYVNREDAKTHEILLCIQMGKTLKDEGRMEFETNEFYFKTTDEMYKLFPEDQEALYNTHLISERCDVTFNFDVIHLPQYISEYDCSNKELFDKICMEGLKKRYPNITEEIRSRFEYEKSVIETMGYVEYFLIVWDFIRYAKKNRIIVGPGRGSAAGSIISYCLDITDVDPIAYNLLFERFLNPERVSMPDIDIDFCYERREEVIDYVKKKYGEDHVAQIITFGTLGARAAIRDVGRVLGMSYADVDKVAKEVPFSLGMTIDTALKMNPSLKKMYENDPRIRELIDFSKGIEGLPRHASTHAAGIVISKDKLDEHVPLYMHQNSVATQFPMSTLESLGLLKMDFLGLRTLTVIQKTLRTIEKVYHTKLDFSKIPMNDPKVYELLSSGNTLGIFQLESSGMRSFLKEFRPESFEDIVAGISLYRPGPMESIPAYIKNKNGAKINYLHPKLEPILRVTNGIMIYQEQVMQIVRELGGYSYARADLVRKAMSKKQMDIMEEEREYFVNGKIDENGEILISGCIRKGIDSSTANKIYDEMIDFAKYAFNKSHAACYGVLAYQTAYLKTFYPVAFMASLMTSVMGRTEKVVEYIRECHTLKIEVLNPDINRSKNYFSVEEDKIRFALSSLKNIGENVVLCIVKEIEENGHFVSLHDFIRRLPQPVASKRVIETLIKSGSFDSLHSNRAQLLANYEEISDRVHSRSKQTIAGQVSLFETEGDQSSSFQDDFDFKVSDFSIKEKLSMEKDVIGLYISGHPLEEYKEVIEKYSKTTILDLLHLRDEKLQTGDFSEFKTILSGIIQSKSIKYTRNNRLMAFLSLEDLTSSLEVVVFPNIVERYLDLLNEDEPVIVYGTVQFKEDEDPKILADKIESLKEKRFKKLYIQICEDSNLKEIKYLIKKYPGKDTVIFFDKLKQRAFELESYKHISADPLVLKRLAEVAGKDNIKIKEPS